jgi:transposase
MKVREVCTDMDPFYSAVAKVAFPNAIIVIDHYHVIAWALHLMDEIRISLQAVHRKKFAVKHLLMKPAQHLTDEEYKKLQLCFEAYPDVKRAWKIAHQLRRVYWQKNWRQACSELRKTIWYCHQSGIPEMKALAKTLIKWKYGILGYYRSKTTNAFTEGSHTRFELIKRGHCGIRNIDRFAKRLMFCMLPFTVIAQIFAQRV